MLACGELRRNAGLCKATADIGPLALYIKPRPAPSGFLALENAVTGSTRSSEGLDARRRRLLFRSWHRGIREMDLILGRFADAYIGELGDPELDEYERLIENPDPDLLNWVTGTSATPAAYDTAMLRRLRDFHLLVK